MYIVLLGAPGSGKGTVGKILSEDLKLSHISTGDLFRENLKNGTDLGNKIAEYMKSGNLVPDEITMEILSKRLNCEDTKNGAILDGFPRTKAQAKSLDKILRRINAKVDIAINIDVPFNEIIKRIENRRNCKKCGAIYNIVFNPPIKPNVCDICGGELYQREDQKPEIVKNRLEVYDNSSKELITYYKNEGILYSVKAGEVAGKTSYDVAKDVEKRLKNERIF